MKADVIFCVASILFIWICIWTAFSLGEVAQKYRETEAKRQILQQKVNAKKASGELKDSEFFETFLDKKKRKRKGFDHSSP